MARSPWRRIPVASIAGELTVLRTRLSFTKTSAEPCHPNSLSGDFHLATRERAAVDRQTLLALGRSDGTPMKGSLQVRNQPLTSPLGWFVNRARADRRETALVVVARKPKSLARNNKTECSPFG